MFRRAECEDGDVRQTLSSHIKEKCQTDSSSKDFVSVRDNNRECLWITNTVTVLSD